MVTWQVRLGDVRETLASLPDASVQCCVTSPPYFGLRDYGVDGQIGMEAEPGVYIDSLVAVFRDVRRAIRDDGTLWLNLGDSYANDGKWGGHSGGKHVKALHCSPIGRNKRYMGLKPKDMIGIPWMVAFALRADGWYLRSDIIWSKPNPMPESVTDRPTKSHEYIFLLTKAARYYYDAEAIKEPASPNTNPRASKSELDRVRALLEGGANTSAGTGRSGGKVHAVDGMVKSNTSFENAVCLPVDTRNKRSVWHIATQPYPEAHFATYPEALIEPCILAGSRVGDTVLDPFTGSGTTGAVAVRHQRSFIGCELNPAYLELARKRIGDVAPLLARECA